MVTPTEDIHLIREYLKTKASSSCFAFVARHQNAVFGLCYRILNNREEAEEAAQDTFIKFFESLEKLKDVSKFRSWLMSIAYRTGIDYHRKKKPYEDDLDRATPLMIPDQWDPDQALRKKQRLELLEQLFAQMNPQDSSILELHYVQDQSVKAIADMLNLSESNVKVRLMRSREVLKKKISPAYKYELNP